MVSYKSGVIHAKEVNLSASLPTKSSSKFEGSYISNQALKTIGKRNEYYSKLCSHYFSLNVSENRRKVLKAATVSYYRVKLQALNPFKTEIKIRLKGNKLKKISNFNSTEANPNNPDLFQIQSSSLPILYKTQKKINKNQIKLMQQ
jgi:hypothetical protein